MIIPTNSNLIYTLELDFMALSSTCSSTAEASREFGQTVDVEALRQAEYQLQESYFNILVKKEQMEEKMRGIREMKCRAVTCKKVIGPIHIVQMD